MTTTAQPSDAARKSINYNFTKSSQPRKPPHAGKGRYKGKTNLVNLSIREIFAEFVYKNASTAQELYEKVAKKDPAKALQILTNLADFILPRLQRTEMKMEGSSLVSQEPIADAAQAANIYVAILGNSNLDLTKVTFDPPIPQESVVAVQPAADEIESGPEPEPYPTNVTSLYQRLGK
jgi:hypothetical protein